MEIVRKTMCPKCGGKLQRINSVVAREDGEHRQKTCCNCGHVFYTVVKKKEVANENVREDNGDEN